MDIDSCMKSCSSESLITPTKASFEDAIECMKLLAKISLIQFADPILQMGIDECLSILRASNKLPDTILIGLEAQVDSLLLQQRFLASALPSREDLSAKEVQVQRVQEDTQYWVTQKATYESKRDKLLKVKELLEEQLRKTNEKLAANQALLSMTEAKVNEYSSMLQSASIVSTTLARHRNFFSKVITESNIVVISFRDFVTNNL